MTFAKYKVREIEGEEEWQSIEDSCRFLIKQKPTTKIEFNLSTIFHLQYQVKMTSTSTKGLFLLITFLALLSTAKGTNWQGSGNITSEHMTFFWNYINANMSGPASTYALNPFCEQFSTALNTKWDPAWNVVISFSDSLIDTVLYGYAYNGHWYWYNGYGGLGKYFGIVIWKDYNCQGWKTLDAGASGFNSSQKTQIETAVQPQASKPGSNIWNIAEDFMTALTAQSLFSGTSHAYSVVMSASARPMWGRICLVGSNFYHVSNDYSGGSIGKAPFGVPWGNLLLFQTR